MRKAIYKGGHLPLISGIIYNVRLIWDDDCGYVYVYVWTLDGNIKCVYDGEAEMEKEWQLENVDTCNFKKG